MIPGAYATARPKPLYKTKIYTIYEKVHSIYLHKQVITNIFGVGDAQTKQIPSGKVLEMIMLTNSSGKVVDCKAHKQCTGINEKTSTCN